MGGARRAPCGETTFDVILSFETERGRLAPRLGAVMIVTTARTARMLIGWALFCRQSCGRLPCQSARVDSIRFLTERCRPFHAATVTFIGCRQYSDAHPCVLANGARRCWGGVFWRRVVVRLGYRRKTK